MDNYSIDRIISMLRDKWYVRCNVDWIYTEHFEYIQNNPNSYEWLWIKIKRYKTSLPAKDYQDDVYIYDERTWREIPEPRRYIQYDLLININRKTIDEVMEMYNPKLEELDNDEQEYYGEE